MTRQMHLFWQRCGGENTRPSASFTVSPDDLRRLQRTIPDRNPPQQHAWRSRIIPLTDQGLGTMAIPKATGKAKNCIWRWNATGKKPLASGMIDGIARLTSVAIARDDDLVDGARDG